MANHSCGTGCNHGISVDLFDSDKKGQQGMLEVRIEETSIKSKNAGKTTLDVAGICCPSEVPLIRKLIEPLPGVHEVLVNVTAKTVTVHHDPALTSPSWLVKVLNDAKLEASIHNRGEWKATHKWPSPYTIASGFMVALTFFQYVYSPLKWVGLGAVAIGAPPVIIRALVSLRRCILDINVLMIIAVSGAIGLGDYLEAGSIVFLFTLADWLESRSSDKARMAIAAIANLAPQHAFLAGDGLKVPVGEVIVGTRIAVKAGELVPIDGSVVSGMSTIDESSLTGEPLPVEKVAGATVWAGTLNLTGYLCIETTALAEDSTVARMIRLVEEAQTERSHIERLVEKFAKYYTPVILIIAIVTATVPLALHVHNARHWLYLALVLLVAACPCALVISTPVTTTCAIAQAARIGLVVKGGDSLEALGKLKMIAMDKTGTLTEGHFRVKEVCLLNNDVDLLEVLYWIACIENKASHPMASSFVAYAKMHGIIPSGEVKDFEVLVGEGVTGVLDGRVIHIGNERMAKRLHWNESNPMVLETWKREGWTVSWVGIDEKLQAILCAGDHLRPEAKEALSALRKIGLQITMLTGDCQAAADIIQEKLGDLNVHAQLLPKDKVEILKQLKKMGLTGMVGDGTNDAPALASADVGIAMGVAGSAMAMEAADISLMTNDLRQLPIAVKLGRRAFQKIIQNIILSLCTKTLIIILAVLGYASLWAAVLADVGTCLLVIFNSMLLLERQKSKTKSHGDHKEKTHHHHHSHCAHGENDHDHHHSHCEHKESKRDHQHNHGSQEECKQDHHHSHGGHEECKHDPHHQQSKHGYHHHHQQGHCDHEESKHGSQEECKHGSQEECKHDPHHQQSKHGHHHHHHHHHQQGHCDHEESKHDDGHNYCGQKENKQEHYKECKHDLHHSHGDNKENKHGDNFHSHCDNEEKKHDHNHHNHCDHKESKHDYDHCLWDHDKTKHDHSHGDHEECKHDHHHSHGNHGECKHDHHHSHADHEDCKHDHHHSHSDHEKCKHDHSHGNHEECKHDHHHSHGNHEECKHDHHHSHDDHEDCKHDHHHSHGDHEKCKHDHDHHSICDHQESKRDDHHHGHCNHEENKHDNHHDNHCDHVASKCDHHGHGVHEECKDDQHDDHEASKHEDDHDHSCCGHEEIKREFNDDHIHCDHKECRRDDHNHSDHKESKHSHHHSHEDHKECKHDHHDNHEASKHDDQYHSHCIHKQSKHNHQHSHGNHEGCQHDHLHNHKASKHEDDYYSHCDHKDNLSSHGDHEECKHGHHHSNVDNKSNKDDNHQCSHYSYKTCKHDDDDDGSCCSDHYNKTSEHNHDHSHNDHRHCEKRIIWLQSAVNCLAHLGKSSDNKKHCCHKKSDCGGSHPLSAVCCESKIPIPPKKKMLTYGDKTGHNLCFHIPKKVASFTEEDLSSVTLNPKSKDRDEFLCAIYCCETLSQPGDKNACVN